MALHSLATRMRIPAAPALRRRPNLAVAVAVAARSRFLGTTREAEQHANGSLNAARPLDTMDDELLYEALYKVSEALSKQDEELEKVHHEIKRITKWYACTIVGVPLLAWGVEMCE